MNIERQNQQHATLCYLYECASESQMSASRDLCDELGIHFDEFCAHVYEDLREAGLVAPVTMGGSRGFTLKLTPAGCVHAEQLRGTDGQRREAVQALRVEVLRRLASARHEKGRLGCLSHFELCHEENGSSVHLALQVLEYLSLVDRKSASRWFITQEGIAALDRLNARQTRLNRFAEIQKLSPQRRGKKLEQVLAAAMREQDCDCDEDTGGKGEQIDLVIRCGTSYFVCECKWEKARIQGGVIDQMATRLRRRPPFFIGVIFSMSGFTSGAIHNATRELGDRAILLIDEADTRAIILGEKFFIHVIDQQLRQIATQAAHQAHI